MASRRRRMSFPTEEAGKKFAGLRVMFSVTPEQPAALQADTAKGMRARARGSLKPDAGEIFREALDD